VKQLPSDGGFLQPHLLVGGIRFDPGAGGLLVQPFLDDGDAMRYAGEGAGAGGLVA